nr:hypothetical protein [Halorussus litoreus]
MWGRAGVFYPGRVVTLPAVCVSLIGATALLVDEPVVTRNSDYFERIDGLDVETY